MAWPNFTMQCQSQQRSALEMLDDIVEFCDDPMNAPNLDWQQVRAKAGACRSNILHGAHGTRSDPLKHRDICRAWHRIQPGTVPQPPDPEAVRGDVDHGGGGGITQTWPDTSAACAGSSQSAKKMLDEIIRFCDKPARRGDAKWQAVRAAAKDCLERHAHDAHATRSDAKKHKDVCSAWQLVRKPQPNPVRVLKELKHGA